MRKKVLIVEDEADQRKMMKIVLGFYGFEVIEAADGYEAVEKAVEQTPDLILMDMAMPVMSGLDSILTMRSHASLDNTPIVAVTGYDDFYADRARAAGCNDVIRKPLDFARLKPLVEHYTN